MNKNIILLLILLGILSGCSLRSLHSGSTYESGEMGSPTYLKKGVILSVRDVVIKVLNLESVWQQELPLEVLLVQL